MIELKRLKLINWHNFENTTFDCARLTYMIGVNAVGMRISCRRSGKGSGPSSGCRPMV